MMAAYVALFVTVAAVIAGAIVWQTNELLTRQVLTTISAEAEQLETLARMQGPASVADAVAERSWAGRTHLYFLADVGAGRIAGNLNRWPPELRDGAGGLFRYTPEPGLETHERFAIGVPVTLDGGRQLLVARDVEEQREFIGRVRTLFIAGFGLLVLIGLAGGIAASRQILKRIAAITATSESIMTGDLSRRIASSGSGDELDELARNLNQMLDRIEQLMAGLREVSDNIAHDLKTPLNRLRNRAEAALREAHTAEDYREGLGRTIDEADEIIKTFNALLLIARLEAGAVDETMETFDLTALVRDVVELYEPHAEESHRRLRFHADGEILVRANRQLIGQAVANVLDNAIKYGGRPSGGGASEIEVVLAQKADRVELAVADNGPGIPSLDRERALKRFVRLEASRTEPGTGLGLSLVAAVLRLHKGSVRLEDNRPGLRVVLSWPVPAVLHAREGQPPGTRAMVDS
ncbi:MAG: HAMP domain-containing protein [Hyphomicrobiaceae bacterium]|nr:HAMP domain-containing protein [Hyphomicrobiaceae bacterium]